MKKVLTLSPIGLKRFLTKVNPKVDLMLIDLLGKLLVYDPNKRLTAAEALADPYFLKREED